MQEYSVVLLACFPHTKWLHFLHLWSDFESDFRGHDWHRPRFFDWFDADGLGPGWTPIASIAFATEGWCEIDGFAERRAIIGSIHWLATSSRNRRRLSRRLEHWWFFHCGFLRFQSTNALRQEASDIKMSAVYYYECIDKNVKMSVAFNGKINK